MSKIPHPGLFPESLAPSPASYNFSTLAACVPASVLVALLYRAASQEDNNNPIQLIIALGAILISWMAGNMVDINLWAGAMQVSSASDNTRIMPLRVGSNCC